MSFLLEFSAEVRSSVERLDDDTMNESSFIDRFSTTSVLVSSNIQSTSGNFWPIYHSKGLSSFVVPSIGPEHQN